MDHKKVIPFVNEDGFEEWWTEDRKGNIVNCFSNNLLEIHVKRPRCECGRILRKVKSGLWECGKCNTTYTLGSLFRQYETYDDYDPDECALQDDYGDRKYLSKRLLCGPEELYNQYRPSNLKR